MNAGDAKVDILIVDDDPRNLLALEAMLARPEYRIVRAASGPEALKRVLERDFCVILLDVLMPGIDGFEVATLLKRRERSRHVPLIFLTAGPHDARRAFKAYSIGAVDYLEKPVDVEIVRAKVAAFVDLQRMAARLRRQAELLRESERRERERALAELRRESEQRYLNLAEAIPEIVWTASPAGEAEYFNRRWHDFTGLAREQSAGAGWFAAVHPEEAGRTVERWTSAVRDGKPYEIEVRLRRASDGAWRWHLCRALPERGPGGEVLAWLGTCTDIDDRRRAEEERAELYRREHAARAQAEEAHGRAAFLAHVGRELAGSLDPTATLAKVAALAVPRLAEWCLVYLAEPDGTLRRVAGTHADPAKEPLLVELRALHPLDLAGTHPVVEAMRSGRPEAIASVSERQLEDMATGPEHLALLRALGVRSTAVVPLAARGRTLGAIRLARSAEDRPYGDEEIALAEDLARRAALAIDNAQLYRQAEQAIAVRDDFLSVASHELKTPLTALMLHVQSLVREAERGGGAGERAETALRSLRGAERQVHRLSRLVNELLDVARMKRGRVELDLRPADLGRVVADVATRLRPEIEAAGCTLGLSGEGGVAGRWDPARLEQVVANLVSNAIKYGAGKPIDVAIERDGALARLRVRDRGIGIDRRDQGRIFERFERAVSARPYGGLGLGLYIARRIVEAHGGSISVESAPGEGAAFAVELPLEPAVAEAREPEAARQTDGDVAKA